MTWLEFFFINFLYTALFFAYKLEREYIWTKLKECLAICVRIALASPITSQILLLLNFLRAQYPSVKREGKMLHISFVERKARYDIFLPHNRNDRKAKKYCLSKGGKVVREFTAPAGIPLFCTEKDFACDEIIEIDQTS